MNKEYKNKIRSELERYDMSFKAFILGYDSWYIGTYIFLKRIVDYYRRNNMITSRLIMFGQMDNAKSRKKSGLPVQ